MNGLKHTFFIGIGGALGAILSYTILELTKQYTLYSIPILTILFYGITCFLFSFMVTYFKSTENNIPEEVQLGITQGFLGSLVPFAIFNYTLISYIEKGSYIQALEFGGLNIIVCLLLSFYGFASAEKIKSRKGN